MTIQQIQAAIDSKANDPRQLINMIADYLQANPGGGGAPYLVYTALLTQTGTDAPTALVYQNTFGEEIIWTRSNAGKYVATLTGAFTLNKTICPPFQNLNTQIGIYVDLPNDHGYGMQANTIDTCFLYLNKNSDGSYVDISAAIPGGILVEIRTYQ